MKEITSNKKYVLSLVDPDEVFDILGKSDGKGLFCRCIKGKYQAATHELKYLKVTDIKNYIEDAKNNDPNEFIIFYRVAENKGDIKKVPEKVGITIDGVTFSFNVTALEEAKRICTSGPCGHKTCPLAMWQGCTHILNSYEKGNFKEV